MRVLVTGCRHWRPDALAAEVIGRLLDRYGVPLVIVHGNAPGVDATFRDVADAMLAPDTEAHAADWDHYGRGAGPRRNAEMVALGADLCLAIHRDIRSSLGTRDCARRAIEAGIPTYLIDSDAIPSRPRRIGIADLDRRP